MTRPTIANLRPLEDIYRDRWHQYGVSPQSLGWTKGKQQIRFNILLTDLHCEGKSFLDVGCGFGDLNIALRRRAQRYRYLGLDMVEEFIVQARQQYGVEGVDFQLGDFQATNLSGGFDIVLASGLFAFLLTDLDNEAYIANTLDKMMHLCDEAVTVDFLSDKVKFRRDGTFYANPSRMLDLALGLTRNVRLRHDYMPFEFSLTLFKDDSFKEHDTIFNRFKHEKRHH